jgi:hypothetical protein
MVEGPGLLCATCLNRWQLVEEGNRGAHKQERKEAAGGGEGWQCRTENL